MFFAPRLQARFGTAKVLYVNLAALGVVMTVIGAGVGDPSTVIVAVIVSGAFIGINNTLTTQAVMLVSPVERPVASSAYGFVRFIGGGLAPFVAGKLADAWSPVRPVLRRRRRPSCWRSPCWPPGTTLLGRAERDLATPADTARLEPVGTAATRSARPVVVAVGATPDAALVVDAAAAVARDLGAPLEVVHVRETVVVEELAIDPEPLETARATLAAHLERLTGAGVATTGQLLHSVGDHAAAARVLAAHASEVDARTVAIGPSPRGPLAQFTDGSFTAALTAAAPTRVLLLRPDEEPRELTTATLADLRA